MRNILLSILLLPYSALAQNGNLPASEISIAGVKVGDSPIQVQSRLGRPSKVVKESDYLDTHYEYSRLTVSFSEGVVAGLYSDKPQGCTPKGLCTGDSLEKMQRLYGNPNSANRETGRFYEYYGKDLFCWLQISAKGNSVKSIRVACQP
jgi:hypothetical protein